jgi:hypothetical protein
MKSSASPASLLIDMADRRNGGHGFIARHKKSTATPMLPRHGSALLKQSGELLDSLRRRLGSIHCKEAQIRAPDRTLALRPCYGRQRDGGDGFDP